MIDCRAMVRYREPCQSLPKSGNTSHWLLAKKVLLRTGDRDELLWLLIEIAEDALRDKPSADAVHVEARYIERVTARNGEMRYAISYFVERKEDAN